MNGKTGFLEIIAGPMYCGKTEELIRLVKRAVIGHKKVQVFKHAIDTRYGTDKKLYSHAGMMFDSETVNTAMELLGKVKNDTEIIAIDESQWFGKELVGVIQKLLSQGKYIIVAGLALTFDRQPFLPMPELMAMADKVTKLSAVCSICGADAVFHKRVVKGKTVSALKPNQSLVSSLKQNIYQARCRNCFDKKP